MNATEWIAQRRELLDAATEGPWAYGTPGDEMAGVSVGDYLASFARDEDGPATGLWLTWQDGQVNPVISPAVTGDGPTSAANAAFIADARTSLPRALGALESVLATLPPAGAEKFGPDFEAGVAKGWQLARAAIESVLGGES